MVQMLQQVLDAPIPAITGIGQPLGEEGEGSPCASAVDPGEGTHRGWHPGKAQRGEVGLEVGYVRGPQVRLCQPLDDHRSTHDDRLVGLVDTDGTLAPQVTDRP